MNTNRYLITSKKQSLTLSMLLFPFSASSRLFSRQNPNQPICPDPWAPTLSGIPNYNTFTSSPANLTVSLRFGVDNDCLKWANKTPANFQISQNFQYQLNSNSVSGILIASQEKVGLKLYDLPGREVQMFVNDIKDPGSYNVMLNAANFSS